MKFWLNNPGVRILFPFALGIITAAMLQIDHFLIVVSCVFSILVLFIFFWFSTFRNRKLIGILVTVTVFLIGYQYTIVRTQKLNKNHFSYTLQTSDYYHVTVIERLIEKENSYKTILQVNRALGETESNCTGKILVYLKKSEKVKQLDYGDELIIQNKINGVEGARNPNQFDYSQYLNLFQINYQMFLDSNSWQKTGKNSRNKLIDFAQSMREKLYSYLENNGVEGKQLKVGSALLLGYKENLDKDLIKSYSSAGAMHVLAVSGLHVGILYLLLSNFLNLFRKLKNSRYLFAFILIISLKVAEKDFLKS